MTLNNKFQKMLLKILPYFKGSWLIYTYLFRMLPYNLRYASLGKSGIVLDLSDPPQFSIAKVRNGIVEPATTSFIKHWTAPPKLDKIC